MTASEGRPRTVPLDPDSPKGREVTARLTRTLALISLEIEQRKRDQERARRAAGAATKTALVALVALAVALPVRLRGPDDPASRGVDDPGREMPAAVRGRLARAWRELLESRRAAAAAEAAGGGS